MSKICFKCHVEQPLENFYKHSKMADGRLGKCKECTKKGTNQNYHANFERYHEYERRRFQQPERKQKVVEYARLRRVRTPLKDKARQAIGNAIRDGKMIRQPCEVCGTTSRVQAHHPDYSKPLDVKWLCFTHHRAEHGQMTAEARAAHRQNEAASPF